MIKYKLNCKDCAQSFDSWFATSKEYDRVKKMNLINCHNCNSTNIDKSLMTPNLLKTKKNEISTRNKKFTKVKNKLKKYQKFIKSNFEYVGGNFSYEARLIHYNKKKTQKGIYGNATQKDVKELKEEGIETEMIPWIEDKEN